MIADPSVDREFGTGAVKVTPAHDKRDHELSLRHPDLPAAITMFDESGCVTDEFQPFAGTLFLFIPPLPSVTLIAYGHL